MAKSAGKIFEDCWESSCADQKVFFFRVRDVSLPPDLRMRIKLPQNKYDCLLFYKNHLLPVELKSTKDKSISMKEHMIKAHQLKSLEKATDFEGVIPGLVLNFRDAPGNRAFFIHIKDFLDYKYVAEHQVLDHPYKSKVNKSSIPIGICEEIGVEVTNIKKVKHYRYYINKMIDELIEKYKDK